MPRTKKQFEEIRKSSRQKILDAALEVFAKYGFHSSSVGSIAKAAGISQGLLYNYFKSKEELLYELMMGMIIPIMEEIMPVKAGEKITRNDMVVIINQSIDLVLEKPEYWKLYTSVFVQPDVMTLLMEKMMQMAQPYLTAMVEYFKERGEEDPSTMVRYFSAVMDGIQIHCMVDPKTFPVEQIKKMLIKQFA